MTPFQYWLSGWERSSDRDGRSRRREYAWFMLGNTLIQLAVVGVFALVFMFRPDAKEMLATLVRAVKLGARLIMVKPTFAIITRRLHDLGHSAWFILWGLLPAVAMSVVAIVMTLQAGNKDALFLWVAIGLYMLVINGYLLFAPGQPGENKWGVNPTAEAQPA